MRFALNEITPKRVFEACKRRITDIPRAISWRLSNDAKVNCSKLLKYRDIHSNKRCFIIANGPSLKKMDLLQLRNEITFSMNRAYLLYEEWGFSPTYFVCINELVIDQFREDIMKLEMPKFLNYNCINSFDLSQIADHDSYNFLRIGLSLNDRFCDDITKPISSGGTVTFSCLQLAYYMGFSEAILLGLDHNFVEKGTPTKTVVRNESTDESHCHPDYFPKGIKWQLPDLYRSELAYALARKAFENDGRTILDATIDGKCEVFNKINFEDCL